MIKLPFTFLPPQAVFTLSRPFMSAAKKDNAHVSVPWNGP